MGRGVCGRGVAALPGCARSYFGSGAGAGAGMSPCSSGIRQVDGPDRLVPLVVHDDPVHGARWRLLVDPDEGLPLVGPRLEQPDVPVLFGIAADGEVHRVARTQLALRDRRAHSADRLGRVVRDARGRARIGRAVHRATGRVAALRVDAGGSVARADRVGGDRGVPQGPTVPTLRSRPRRPRRMSARTDSPPLSPTGGLTAR